MLFRSNGLVISDMQLMGRDEAKHVKLTLDTGKNQPRDFRWTGLYWNAADKIKVEFDMNDTVDIIYNLGRDWFTGNEKPQMIIRDLKRHE